ncbi:GIY-YIG nuclease family protein [Bifidobacterium sp. 81T8]|nr:GIY-YIG nuclease family protein [Bifidobacterium simiiventris]
MTNWNNKVMYVGMTNNLLRRLSEHRNHRVDGFTDRYNVTKLVHYESVEDVRVAIEREKQIKKWNRDKKNRLVELTNPQWNDLAKDLVG